MTEYKEWRIAAFSNSNTSNFYFDDMWDAIRWTIENQNEYKTIFILKRITSTSDNVYDVTAQLK